jgi:hypothetical protein
VEDGFFLIKEPLLACAFGLQQLENRCSVHSVTSGVRRDENRMHDLIVERGIE